MDVHPHGLAERPPGTIEDVPEAYLLSQRVKEISSLGHLSALVLQQPSATIAPR